MSLKEYRLRMLQFLGFIPDKTMVKMQYRIKIRKKLNIENPKTYCEKLQWLKLNYHNPILTRLVDKYEVRQFITERIGADYLVPIYGNYDNFDQINIDKLPNQFVMKCTHDSGSVIICKDKTKFDVEAARKKLTGRLKNNPYHYGREWPYKGVKPRIIIEKYLIDVPDGCEITEKNDALIDYKFFCFNGKPEFMYVSRDKASVPTTDFYDMDFNHLPFKMRDPNSNIPIDKPEMFEEMKEFASKLSAGFPHVRIDVYCVSGHLYFGEMTFYHGSGYVPVNPDEWNIKLGDMITLPQKM